MKSSHYKNLNRSHEDPRIDLMHLSIDQRKIRCIQKYFRFRRDVPYDQVCSSVCEILKTATGNSLIIPSKGNTSGGRGSRELVVTSSKLTGLVQGCRDTPKKIMQTSTRPQVLKKIVTVLFPQRKKATICRSTTNYIKFS